MQPEISQCRHGVCVQPYCGDQILDDTEMCDGPQLDGESCITKGFETGTLGCASNCTFDTSGCNTCGDGTISGGEVCDGNDFGSHSCQTHGFASGDLTCRSDCSGFFLEGCSSSGFVQIGKGTFIMGSPDSEPCRDPDETLHEVTLTHAFEISAHEVTQGEFQELMGYNPAYFSSSGTSYPVEYVTWHEAAAYCNALSSQRGLAPCYSCSGSGSSVVCDVAATYDGTSKTIHDCPGYRLPTEAEWEYAYRAGSDTFIYPSAGNDGSITDCHGTDPNADQIGWYKSNSSVSYPGCDDLSSVGGDACSGTHPVGLKAPNGWGLYDIAGNVWEWCHDRYQSNLGTASVTDPWGAGSGMLRVLRGGSWYNNPGSMMAANRSPSLAEVQLNWIGFRPCRTRS